MAVVGLVAGEYRSVVTIDGAHIAFETVPQVGYVTAPLEVSGKIPQRNAESGEHHHRDVDGGSQECSILQYEIKILFIASYIANIIDLNESNSKCVPITIIKYTYW